MELLRDLLLIVAGPTGIFLGWWLPRRDKVEDRQERKSEILRTKAEEIYQEIEAVGQCSLKATSQAAVLLKKDSTAPEGVLVVSVGRLRGLMAIYFPDGSPLFLDYDQKSDERTEWLRKKLESGPNKSLPEVEAIRGYTFGYAMFCQADVQALLKRLREFMDERAKLLL